MFNGCVVDCRGAVEDTVKVFGPSLQDLFFLSKQGVPSGPRTGQDPQG